MKRIKGRVMGACYVPQVRAIVITLKELSSGKILKPISIYEESFIFRPDQDIDYEMGKTAEQLKNFKYAVTIEYDDSKQ